ncbi:MAG: hypothetical protein Q9220_006073 [cf. Caloplaca sp. 1 TL-2023]
MRQTLSILFAVAALVSSISCAPVSELLGIAKATFLRARSPACTLYLCATDEPNTDSSSSKTPGYPNDPGAAPMNPEQEQCSADSSNAPVAPFAQDPAWAPSMLTCLGYLNVPDWVDSAECSPNNGNGTVLGGTSFGFYSKGVKWGDQMNCFEKCMVCLAKGIENHRAVTTSCLYNAGGGSYCEMGFKYGE